MRLSVSRVVAVLAGMMLAGVSAVLVGYGGEGMPASANAGADGGAHGALVIETPTSGWPQILGTPNYLDEDDVRNREVFAAARVGNVMVVGGNFHEIKRLDGSVVIRRFLAAFDRSTGALIDVFDPVLDQEVLALHADPDGEHVLVGGRFNSVDGLDHRKLVRIHVPTGVVDTSFRANGDAAVNTIDVTSDGRVFAGGVFNSINGVPVADVAEIHPGTGAAITAFDFAFTGISARGTFRQFSNGEVKHVEATPDGDTLVVVHRAAQIDGQTRSGYAVFDIADQANPTLTNDHSNSFFEWPTCAGGPLPTSAALSPDGTTLVMGTITFDLPECHDAVLAFPVGGGPDSAARWSHQMRDSVFSVAASDVAVYAGGHFCRIDSGPGVTNDAGRDDKFCTGSNQNHSDGAWRYQLAALSPADGTPLDWDPGNNAFRGATFLQATSTGLLMGFDGDRVNDVVTGAFAELQIGDVVPDPDPDPEPDPDPDPDPEPDPDPTPQPFCLGVEADIVGTDGADELVGTAGNDVIVGFGGNDIIRGGGGDDVICGGDGNDRIWGGDGNDLLVGGFGRDRLRGELGRDTLFGFQGRDRLSGGSGVDTLNGGTGNDRMFGNSANDLMAGENGRDVLNGGPGNDMLRGGGGNDRLFGNDGTDTLNGGNATDECREPGGGEVIRCELTD